MAKLPVAPPSRPAAFHCRRCFTNALQCRDDLHPARAVLSGQAHMQTHYSVSILLVIGAAALSVRPSRVNPPVEPTHTIESQLSPPAEVSALLVRSCADCHSNRTEWPWYSRLEPAATLIGRDVEKGRAAMNFSEWPSDAKGAGLLLAACSAMEAGIMPKQPYRTMHPGTAPTPDQIKAFCTWSHEQARKLMTMRRLKAEAAQQP